MRKSTHLHSATLAIVVAVLAASRAPAPSAAPPAKPANSASAASSDSGNLRAQFDVARALLDQRANVEGIAALRVLLPQAEASRDGALLLEVVYHMARAHFQMTDYSAAHTMLERALALSRQRKDRAFEARICRSIGETYRQQGYYSQALKAFEDAAAIFEELGDRRGAAKTWRSIGSARDQMGELPLAIAAYNKARVVLQETEDWDFYTLLNEVGITYTNMGRYQDALQSLMASLEGRRRLGDLFAQGISHSNIGEVHRALGQYERASWHHEQALALCRQANEKRCATIALGSLAQDSTALGDYARALEYARLELQGTRELANRHLEGAALHHIAEAYGSLGDPAQSLAHYRKALDLARSTRALGDEANALVALADISIKLGRFDEARMHAARALELAQRTQSPEFNWRARVVLARVARAGGDYTAAVDHLREGVAIIDSLRGRVLTDAGKIGYLDSRQAVFYELAEILHERGDAAAALEAAEAARGRAFVDLLAARELALKPAATVSLQAIRDAEARLRAQEAQAASFSTEETLLAQLARTRAATETELAGKLRSLHDEQAELASLVAVEPLDAREASGLARRLGATLIEYLVTERRLLIWVVRPTGEIASTKVDVGRDALRSEIRALHARLNDLDAEELRQPAETRRRLADLHRRILAPVAHELPRDPEALVYMVPHDALLLVPFGALIDARGQYLVQQHTLASAPSLGVLRYTTAKKERAISPRRPHLLALADPRAPEDAAQEPLPGARAEVHEIGRRFPADRRLTLFGDQASEANVKRLAPGQTILHLAVHGLLRDDRPWESALILAAGEAEDGWLKAGEIFGLDLRADLVVLSGCSTGLGKLSGDGIVGLSRALIYAGTPSVLVSQWDVSDKSTLYLMDRFYTALTAGRDKAQALRLAQLAALKRYPHPALWAAFTLVGEPQ